MEQIKEENQEYYFQMTKDGHVYFYQVLKKYVVNFEKHNHQIWFSEIEEKFNENETGFEISPEYTKDKNPIRIDLDEKYFEKIIC